MCYITKIIGKTIACPSHVKENVSLLLFSIKSLFRPTHYPPKSITEPFREWKSRHNSCRQAKGHIVLKGIWIWIEECEQWRTVCFLDPLMYKVWSISNSNQKMLAVAQLAGLWDHLEEKKVSATHWSINNILYRMLWLISLISVYFPYML